jgi:hypothetical protein
MIQPPNSDALIKASQCRPPSVRMEITVPKAVMDVLMAREQQTNVYRTRIASEVLCRWASRETGKTVRAYNSFSQ